MNQLAWATRPMPHQVEGVQHLLQQPSAALFDRMGSGKSKQVVDAACELFLVGQVDTVLVLCPAAVRFNWADPDLGQVAKHAWVPTVCQVVSSQQDFVAQNPAALTWVVVSYEWAKSRVGLAKLREELKGRSLLMVADESHRLQSHKSQTTVELTKLRDELKGRGVLLSGTPMGNRYILSLWGQLRFLDKRILPYQNFYHFRARHCVMGGYHNKQVLKYHDTELLDRQLAPYVLRRSAMKLPSKTYSVFEVPLSPRTWKLYRQMRDDLVAWLSSKPGDSSVALNGLTQVLRLAQLTSGILGGFEDHGAREVSTEKQDFLLRWFSELKGLEEPVRFVVWARFRPEMFRLRRELAKLGIREYGLYGGQPKQERDAAVREFQAGSSTTEAVLVGQTEAGGTGLNLPTAHREVFLSHVHALLGRQQAEDRLVRLDSQFEGVQVWDVLATGPNGEKTVDHQIYKNLQAGRELHELTMSQWRSQLLEE